MLILYALFLEGIPFQNTRFLLLTFTVAVILFFPLFLRFYQLLLKSKVSIIIFVDLICIIQTGFIFKYSVGIYNASKLEREISEVIHSFHRQAIYTFAIDGALKTYGVKNRIINLWDELKTIEKRSLILFNEKKFRDQFSKIRTDY